MNRRLVVRLTAVLFAAMLFVVPSQALAGKGGGKKKDKALVVCKHGCKYKTIQKAVDKAKKNGTINVLPGKYVEGVIVNGHKYDGLTIQGMKQKKNGKFKKAKPKQVILEGKNAKSPDGLAQNGIEGRDVNDLTLKNMWARNYATNGFYVDDSAPEDGGNGKIDCNDYLMKNLWASFNRSYGLYAFGCAGGRMTKSVGWGHGDSAFYVGGTPLQNKPKTTRLDHLDGHENVLGFSGTNSHYMNIEKSNFYNNGVGVVPNTLDSEPFEPSGQSVMQKNNIFWNNFNYFLPNSRVKTVSDGLGTVEGIGTIQYPTGAGVVLLGTTEWTVKDNNIFGNFKWGAANISDPFNEDDDAISNRNSFINNQMGRNGTDTNAVDFFNQGSGTGNCFSGNQSSTFDPGTAPNALLYPACPGTPLVTPGQTGTSAGDTAQFGELAGYVTANPPEKQECSWTKHPHPAFKDYKPLEITPGPTCG
jgi:hypothetical protein